MCVFCFAMNQCMSSTAQSASWVDVVLGAQGSGSEKSLSANLYLVFGIRRTRVEAATTLGVVRRFLGLTPRSRGEFVQCLERRLHARALRPRHHPRQVVDLRMPSVERLSIGGIDRRLRSSTSWLCERAISVLGSATRHVFSIVPLGTF